METFPTISAHDWDPTRGVILFHVKTLSDLTDGGDRGMILSIMHNIFAMDEDQLNELNIVLVPLLCLLLLRIRQRERERILQRIRQRDRHRDRHRDRLRVRELDSVRTRRFLHRELVVARNRSRLRRCEDQLLLEHTEEIELSDISDTCNSSLEEIF